MADKVVAVPSNAAIAGHPIHPMLVPLPIGMLSAAFASDLLYAVTGDRFWARAAHMLTGAGLVTGAVAAPFGMIDYATKPEVREHAEAHGHAAGNLAVLGLAAVSWTLRSRDAERAVVPTGLALSALTAGLLGVTGWLGGELSYRHAIGVIRPKKKQKPAA